MSIVKYKALWFSISGALVVASIAMLAIFGLNLGIDFTGGSLLEVAYEADRPAVTEVNDALAAAGYGDGLAQPSDELGLIVRQPVLTEAEHQEVLGVLETFGTVEELRFDSIGPVIGGELKRKSLWALVLIFVLIVAYVAFAFRKVSQYVKSWKYGVLTIVAALHDILIPLGVFAVLGKVSGISIGTAFVAALLTILGYSVNDTIVVFDRVRENLMDGGSDFEEIVDRSIKQTIARSINTTITTLLALVAVLIFGGESTRLFILALIIGIGAGAYSSVFIAAPLLVTWEQRSK